MGIGQNCLKTLLTASYRGEMASESMVRPALHKKSGQKPDAAVIQDFLVSF
jgi:hypothetical protein